MKDALCFVLLLLAAEPAAAGAAGMLKVQPRLEVRERGQELNYGINRTVLILAVDDRPGREPIVMAEQLVSRLVPGVIGAPGGDRRAYWKTSRQWIDGRHCPALAASLSAVPRRSPRKPRAPGQVSIMLKLPKLEANGRWSWLPQPENDAAGTSWWRATDAAVASCWQDAPPRIAEETVPAQLGHDLGTD